MCRQQILPPRRPPDPVHGFERNVNQMQGRPRECVNADARRDPTSRSGAQAIRKQQNHKNTGRGQTAPSRALGALHLADEEGAKPCLPGNTHTTIAKRRWES